MAFELHPAIARDSRLIARAGNIQVRLQNHRSMPWLVLVPEQPGARELHELADSLRQQLTVQQDRVCRLLIDDLKATKLNVAAIGNVVPQLHVHCIGRFESDPDWPGVVWGQPLEPYADLELEVAAWRKRLQLDISD